MKILLGLLFLLASFPLQAQTVYKRLILASGDTITYRVGANGIFDQVQYVPKDGVRSRLGIRLLNSYTPEAKRSFAPQQFGSGKYYDTTYRFSMDFNPTLLSLNQLKLYGVNMFSRFIGTETEYGNLPPPQKRYYQTENELHGPYEGAGYYESSLATLESWYYNHIPSNVGHLIFNIETSNEWTKWRYDEGSGQHGYDSWNTAKSRTIVSERTGETMTLEQLWNSGQWDAEQTVRRANRNALAMSIGRSRNHWVSHGTAMYQGEPKAGALSSTDVFMGGTADVSHIGGDGGGNITLNGHAYTGLNKNVYAYENAQLDYFYFFFFDIARGDYNDIWVNKLPSTQNYPYVWSKIKPEHIVAKEKGHYEALLYRMQNSSGQSVRGVVRMQELIYEANAAGMVDNTYVPANNGGEIFRIPFTELQNTINVGDFHETPKVWLPPYLLYSTYVVSRFISGHTPGSGFHLWNDPGHVRYGGTTSNDYNQEFHSAGSLLQARADLQPYETFYPGSTLVLNPEVQLNQTGSWSSYTGVDAYALGADGSRGTQKPAYLLRYKATTSGWQVVIVGGMNQDWSTSRTDLIRVPSALGGNQFRVKLTGPSAHVFEFSVSSSDSGQTYDATNIISSSKAGYAGRIN